ncbi:uncharacterized protein [Watersipora subatra]|uniref:uncharacterized protein n=1 Tax=Watersipora subatra TaxID=2589382 RepID=UPI00355C2F17
MSDSYITRQKIESLRQDTELLQSQLQHFRLLQQSYHSADKARRKRSSNSNPDLVGVVGKDMRGPVKPELSRTTIFPVTTASPGIKTTSGIQATQATTVAERSTNVRYNTSPVSTVYVTDEYHKRYDGSGNANGNGNIDANENGNNNQGSSNGNINGNINGRATSSPKSSQRSYSGDGLIFTRWGRVVCPQTATLVYSGYAAAANPVLGMGGSTELECLSTYPSWHANSPTSLQTSTKIFAAKFSLGSHTGIFHQAADNSVITCAVCLSNNSPVVTIPGRVDCPSTWLREYNGYMMSTPGLTNQMFFSSRNYCVDRSPDYYTGHNNNKGLKLTFLQAGSCYQNRHPCKNYRENHRLACVVCSKVL